MCRPRNCGQRSVAATTAKVIRSATAARVILLPKRLEKSGCSGFNARALTQSRTRAAVSRHKGIVRCFLPLPCRHTEAGVASSCTSWTQMLINSDTRAPVLYASANMTLSRCPAHLDLSGAANTAFISSADKNPSRGFSKRFRGIARICWANLSACGYCRLT